MADRKIGIKILCEGLEEYKYIKKLLSFPNLFSDIYFFYEPTNCKGINKIFPRYQDIFSKNIYEVVLIFCDADNYSKDFKKLCSDIDNCMFGGSNVSKKIVMFANPVSLQIVLSHISEVKLVSSSKTKNGPIVKKLTGVSNYKGHDEQIEKVMKFVKASNYQTMKQRITQLDSSLAKCPSTNFDTFLGYFEQSNLDWIYDIHKSTKERG